MSISRIAKITGVSDATVSRVLNNKPGPSLETAQAVSLAAREIGYLQRKSRQRNKSAAFSKELKNHIFAFLCFGMETRRSSLHGTPLSVIQGVENTLTKKHFSLSIHFAADEKSIPKTILNGYVDGIFIYGRLALSESTSAKLKKMPTIWLMYNRGDWGSHFTPDNIAIGAKAANYVLSKDGKRIAVLMAGRETPVTPFGERAKGFIDCIRSSQRELSVYCSDRDTALQGLDQGEYSSMISVEINKLIDRMLSDSPCPEFIFVPNDNEVAVLYQQLAARNIKAGVDTVVVTCDGNNLSYIHPLPVIVDIRPDLVGKYAAEYMLTRLASNEDVCDVKMLIQPELTER